MQMATLEQLCKAMETQGWTLQMVSAYMETNYQGKQMPFEEACAILELAKKGMMGEVAEVLWRPISVNGKMVRASCGGRLVECLAESGCDLDEVIKVLMVADCENREKTAWKLRAYRSMFPHASSEDLDRLSLAVMWNLHPEVLRDIVGDVCGDEMVVRAAEQILEKRHSIDMVGRTVHRDEPLVDSFVSTLRQWQGDRKAVILAFKKKWHWDGGLLSSEDVIAIMRCPSDRVQVLETLMIADMFKPQTFTIVKVAGAIPAGSERVEACRVMIRHAKFQLSPQSTIVEAVLHDLRASGGKTLGLNSHIILKGQTFNLPMEAVTVMMCTIEDLYTFFLEYFAPHTYILKLELLLDLIEMRGWTPKNLNLLVMKFCKAGQDEWEAPGKLILDIFNSLNETLGPYPQKLIECMDAIVLRARPGIKDDVMKSLEGRLDVVCKLNHHVASVSELASRMESVMPSDDDTRLLMLEKYLIDHEERHPISTKHIMKILHALHSADTRIRALKSLVKFTNLDEISFAWLFADEGYFQAGKEQCDAMRIIVDSGHISFSSDTNYLREHPCVGYSLSSFMVLFLMVRDKRLVLSARSFGVLLKINALYLSDRYNVGDVITLVENDEECMTYQVNVAMSMIIERAFKLSRKVVSIPVFRRAVLRYFNTKSGDLGPLVDMCNELRDIKFPNPGFLFSHEELHALFDMMPANAAKNVIAIIWSRKWMAEPFASYGVAYDYFKARLIKCDHETLDGMLGLFR